MAIHHPVMPRRAGRAGRERPVYDRGRASGQNPQQPIAEAEYLIRQLEFLGHETRMRLQSRLQAIPWPARFTAAAQTSANRPSRSNARRAAWTRGPRARQWEPRKMATNAALAVSEMCGMD